MKKLVIASVLSLATFSLPAGMAMALQPSGNCGNISFTGENSVNSISCNDNQSVTITCDNKVDIVNVNGQQAGTGSATVNGNTLSGSASSGNANNNNSSNTTANVSCAPASQAVATPPPAAGGMGGGGQVKSAQTSAPATAALPNTGGNVFSSAIIASIVLVTAGAGFVGGVFPAISKRLFSN